MVPYNQDNDHIIELEGIKIASFLKKTETNLDERTVNSFGEEWNKFSGFDEKDLKVTGDQYFDIVGDSVLNKEVEALDVGCGSGRWSRYLSSRVKSIEAIDPSNAILSAAKFNADIENIRWTQASADNIPFDDDSFDFVFSLGVLHHIPDTQQALNDAVKKLKGGGYFLLYLYYALENRSGFYRGLFWISNLFRRFIAMLPGGLKRLVCDIIALIIYLPLVSISRFVKFIFKGELYKKIPLSYYSDKSFYIMRNDSLDRFGTPLEKRFTKTEIKNMMEQSGLGEIVFSDHEPYWHALGKKLA